MLANIMRKCGVIPKYAIEETEQSSGTRESNYVIETCIRKFACLANKLNK